MRRRITSESFENGKMKLEEKRIAEKLIRRVTMRETNGSGEQDIFHCVCVDTRRERRGSPFHIVCSHGPRSRIKAARNASFSHAEQRIERTEGAQEGEKRTEKKDDHVRFSRCARAVPFAERLSKLLDSCIHT